MADSRKDYIKNDCYSLPEAKKLINNGLFGEFNKIVKFEHYIPDNNNKGMRAKLLVLRTNKEKEEVREIDVLLAFEKVDSKTVMHINKASLHRWEDKVVADEDILSCSVGLIEEGGSPP